MKYKDLTGKQFGKITVLNYAESDKNGKAYWNCYCSCNPQKIYKIRGSSLTSKNTLSCGCLNQSHGEYEIEQLLQYNNIQYEKEFIFSELKSIFELRFDFGPGYRVYYTERNGEIVVLLAGGDKSTQKQDIEKAKELAATI